MSLNQNQRVLNHLIDHGYITQLVASSYGIRRLASRIADLKKSGTIISVETRRDDASVRYAYYTLSEWSRALERDVRAAGYDYKGDLVKAAA